MTIWRGIASVAFVTIIVGHGDLKENVAAQAAKPPAGTVPIFQVDSSWLKLPNKWVLGQVAAVTVDAQDNVWIIHRRNAVKPELQAAPPVLEFDSAGNFMRAWGGPGDGYEWPVQEHVVFVDHKGFVWVGGEGSNQILKFTQDGKFVMQIGKSGRSKGLTDTENFVGPTDMVVWPKTNELFVGDTGGHGRVVVLDADTGKFKRMWGGFGSAPLDVGPDEEGGRAGPAAKDVDDGFDPPQLKEVHRIRVSNDGLVYVCDGPNKRFQVFTVDGKFVKQVYVERGRKPLSVVPAMTVTTTGSGFEAKWAEAYIPVATEQLINNHNTSTVVALSTDTEQRYLYVHERSTSKIRIFDRKSLTQIGEFGDGPGRAPGQLFILHDLRVDSGGNIYVAEVNIGSRVQKFVLKGYMTPLAAR